MTNQRAKFVLAPLSSSAFSMSRPCTPGINASRPASRAGARAPSWAARPVEPAGFFSSKPSRHDLFPSASATSIAMSRRDVNSNVPRVDVLFVLGGPSSGKKALCAELAAALPGA